MCIGDVPKLKFMQIRKTQRNYSTLIKVKDKNCLVWRGIVLFNRTTFKVLTNPFNQGSRENPRGLP